MNLRFAQDTDPVMFVVALPVSPLLVAVPAPPPRRAVPTNLRVLVVDDEAELRELMADALAGHGNRVETAGSGREALEILGRSPLDVVVLDVRMPEMPGMVVWTEIKRIRPELARRTVFCTGDVVGEGVRSFLVPPPRRRRSRRRPLMPPANARIIWASNLPCVF